MTVACHSRRRKAVSAALPTFWRSLLFTLTVCIVTAVLHAQTYTDLHDFNCNTDGCVGYYPGSMAQAEDGNLYGTLVVGGSASNDGTIYKITPSGTFTTLYAFSGATDGSAPYSGLTLGTDGWLYGATTHGGSNGYGTVFKIPSTGGTPTTLHSFSSTELGGAYAPPVQGKSTTFYGVTYYGQAYSVTSSGTFKVLPNPTPGGSYAPLILATDGNFYGTTLAGGLGYGTVFRMSTTGAIKVIYNFDNTHGYYPYGPVVQGSDGYLYGTASGGGMAAHPGGVVFRLSTSGVITIIHNFDTTSTTDGYQPIAGLVAGTDGYFYGATSVGVSGSSAQYGTLFKIDKTGINYSVLHTFDSTHGRNPETTPFQHTNGIIYAETYQGTSGLNGNVYSLNATITPFVSLLGFPAGTAGQTVQILGRGLGGTISVKFGAGAATVINKVSDTYITAVVPSSGTSGNVVVTTLTGSLKSKQAFNVIPVISGFTPTSSAVGVSITISGSGFIGAKSVTFGGVKATVFTVNSGTKITATVPTGALTGKIKVTTAGGTATSSGTFTVN